MPQKVPDMSAENLREQISNWAEERETEVLLADGFEDAFLGFGTQFTSQPVAIYDRAKCLQILVDRDGMTEDEALEYFEFNVTGAYVGEQTPIFMARFEK